MNKTTTSGSSTGHIYKIDVRGMNITEYYEFEEHKPLDEVEKIWLDHAARKFGLGVFSFSERTNIEKLSGEIPEEIEPKDGSRLQLR